MSLQCESKETFAATAKPGHPAKSAVRDEVSFRAVSRMAALLTAMLGRTAGLRRGMPDDLPSLGQHLAKNGVQGRNLETC